MFTALEMNCGLMRTVCTDLLPSSFLQSHHRAARGCETLKNVKLRRFTAALVTEISHISPSLHAMVAISFPV